MLLVIEGLTGAVKFYAVLYVLFALAFVAGSNANQMAKSLPANMVVSYDRPA